jgi:Mrp family chromosome partitioning ATPase
MGKMLETFRQPGDVRTFQPVCPAEIEAAPEEETPEEEVPFIEVGPRHSFEASPAVLATIPAPRSQPASTPSTTIARNEAPTDSPRSHHVLFRSLKRPSRFAPELVAFHAPEQPASACYDELLEALQAAVAGKRGEKPAALLFTAVRAEVGATTVLLNIAITAARKGCRVAIVDANLRRPAVAERLGLSPAPGLTEVLSEEIALKAALRSTEQDNLTVLPAGDPAPTLASTEALRTLLAELRRAFDVVLIDGPRWDGRQGVNALAAACDAVFLVAPREESEAPPVNDLVRKLPEQGVALAGCILTGD